MIEAHQAAVEGAKPEDAVLILMDRVNALFRQALSGGVDDEVRAVVARHAAKVRSKPHHAVAALADGEHVIIRQSV